MQNQCYSTALEKCTYLYNDTQGTMKHKRFRQSLRRVCKSRLLIPDEDTLSKSQVRCSILSTSPAVVHSEPTLGFGTVPCIHTLFTALQRPFCSVLCGLWCLTSVCAVYNNSA